jgi:hypothetical protein
MKYFVWTSYITKWPRVRQSFRYDRRPGRRAEPIPDVEKDTVFLPDGGFIPGCSRRKALPST